MAPVTCFEQHIWIAASTDSVDRCITSPDCMAQWLNPLLTCQAIGEWSTEVGGQFRFLMRIPILNPSLDCVVSERQLGLVVWSFQGFLTGSDRWQCVPQDSGTLLVNQFCFTIPNPWIRWGFQLTASALTRQDMQAQLVRLKQVAERLS